MFKLSQAETDEFDRQRARKQARKEKTHALSDVDLATMLEYCLVNCTTLTSNRVRSLTTYEDALVQIYIPELLHRLRGKDEKRRNYDELRKMVNEIAD